MWNVYSADRHLVASYSTQAAAAAHCASWPALYYTFTATPQPPTATDGGLDSPPGKATRMKSNG